MLQSLYSLVNQSAKNELPVAEGRGRGRTAAPGRHSAGAAFEGRKFGILEFANVLADVYIYF